MTASGHAIAADDTSESELLVLLASWRRHLATQRMSPATLAMHSAAVRGLDRFLESVGLLPTSEGPSWTRTTSRLS